MFRKLRERIAEEANRLPVNQINFGNNSLRSPDTPNRSADIEDHIPSDSPSVFVPQPSSQQFSIAEDEDCSMSEPNTPKKQEDSHSINNVAGSSPYIPQTDIESEMEDPPTLNLEGISKEQLLVTIQRLKARLSKYKNRYSEVVRAYKTMNEDKKKIEGALTDNQDKSLRRIAELREQCQLEQKAKAHLEENLRLILEEKDSRISVLEMQINLLKEGHCETASQSSNNTENTEPLSLAENDLQNKDKDKNMSEQLDALRKECDELKEKESKICLEYDKNMEELKKQLSSLKQQEEDNIMSMAETKKNMHEELESREKQLNKTKDELRQIQKALEKERVHSKNLVKHHEDKQRNQLNSMEEEKENLMRDFARGKAEALTLIQEGNAKNTASLEEEWKNQLQIVEAHLTEKTDKCNEINEELTAAKLELTNLQKQVDELQVENKKLTEIADEHKDEIYRSNACSEDIIVPKTAYETGTAKMENMEKQQNEGDSEIEKLRRNLDKLKQENRALKAKDQSLFAKKFEDVQKLEEKLKGHLNALEATLKDSQTQNSSSKESCEKQMILLQQRLAELRERNTVLVDKIKEFSSVGNDEDSSSIGNKYNSLVKTVIELHEQFLNNKGVDEIEEEVSLFRDQLDVAQRGRYNLQKKNQRIVTAMLKRIENSEVVTKNDVNVNDYYMKLIKNLHERVCQLHSDNSGLKALHVKNDQIIHDSINDATTQCTSFMQKLHVQFSKFESSLKDENVSLAKELKDNAEMKTKLEEEISKLVIRLKLRELEVGELQNEIAQYKREFADVDLRVQEINKSESLVSQLRSELSSLDTTHCKTIKELSEKLGIQESESAKLQKQVKILKKELAEREMQIQEDKKSYENLALQFKNDLSASDLASHETIEKLTEELRIRKSEFKELQSEIAKHKKELSNKDAKLQKQTKSNENLVLQLKSELSSLDATNHKEIETLTEKLRATEDEVEKLRLEVTEHLEELSKKESSIQEERKLNNNLVSQLRNEFFTLDSAYHKAIGQLTNKLRTRESEVEELQIEATKATKQLLDSESNESLVLQLRSKLSSNHAVIKELTENLREQEAAVQKLQTETNENRKELTESLRMQEAEIERLQREVTQHLKDLADKESKIQEERKISENLASKLKCEFSSAESENCKIIETLTEKLRIQEAEVQKLQIEATENRKQLVDRELSIQKEKTSNENSVLQLRSELSSNFKVIEELTAKLSMKEAEIEKLQIEITKHLEDLADNKSRIEEERKLSEDLVLQLKGQLSSSDSANHKRIEELIEKNKICEAEMETLKAEAIELRKGLADRESRIQEEKTANENLVLQLKSELSSLDLANRKIVQELNEKLNTRESEAENLTKEISQYKRSWTEQDAKMKEEIESNLSLLSKLQTEFATKDTANCKKIQNLNEKMTKLKQEREQIMIEAQERVSSTEVKHREDMEKLNAEIQELHSQNKEIVKLKEENAILSTQLDESLLVAAANEKETSEQLSKTKQQCEELQEKLSSNTKTYSEKEDELQCIIKCLEVEVEVIKNSKMELDEQVKSLQAKCLSHDCIQAENQELKTELDTLRSLKSEKDELNERIQIFQSSETELNATIESLQNEIDGLNKRCNCTDCACGEISALRHQIELLSSQTPLCPKCETWKDDATRLVVEYESKLQAKDEELQRHLKLVAKEVSNQIHDKDSSCDDTVSEIIEKTFLHEEQLEKEHRIEIAALRQDIFEKDCALEEMHEHYEGIIKEKDSKLQMYSESLKNIQSASTKSSDTELLSNCEPSDWDDTWVIPEENCDNLSSVPDKSTECEEHLQQIESMQKELAKCNSELKDLRILLRLSPPPSLHSNNYNASIQLPEPTEYEYLKNIMFEYMMGKETVTLVKVIAAVLRFTDEQTRLIIEREKAKQPAR